MIEKRLYLALADPVLSGAIVEQFKNLPDCAMLASPDNPDLVIADAPIDVMCPQLVISKNVRAEGTLRLTLPIRLGAVVDQARYLLSSRPRLAGRAGVLELGSVTLSVEDGIMIYVEEDREIRLTDKERQFMISLAEAPGQTLDRKTLLDQVWGYADTVETHTLETHLYRLRQKLEGLTDRITIVSEDGFYRLVF